ncbi:hypothetical protein Lal_00032588 [Lupinus albus]|nr:hypothetical protein Lal_00032588 [Lupinus albus]
MVESRLRWFGHVWTRPLEAPIKRVDQMEKEMEANDHRIYQVASVKHEWNCIKTFPDLSGTGKATCVKFGQDSKYIAVGSMDRNLRIFGLPIEDGSAES